MKLLCPECRTKINFKKLSCQNGHNFYFDENVLILLETDFSKKLNVFLQTLDKIRNKEKRIISNPSIFSKLPFVLKNEIEWKVRCFDLEILEQILPKNRLKILEIGAWNGWLSNFLTEKGHSITTVDYFINEFDGLKAKKFYENKWISIQMDLTDLDLIDEKFDFIVFNRCLQFAPNPFLIFQKATKLLNKKGKILVTGISVFKNSKLKIKEIEKFKEKYKREWDFEIFLKPTKGFFDFEDKNQFEKIGLKFEKYPQLFKQNLKANVLRNLPKHYFGIFKK